MMYSCINLIFMHLTRAFCQNQLINWLPLLIHQILGLLVTGGIMFWQVQLKKRDEACRLVVQAQACMLPGFFISMLMVSDPRAGSLLLIIRDGAGRGGLGRGSPKWENVLETPGFKNQFWNWCSEWSCSWAKCWKYLFVIASVYASLSCVFSECSLKL